jgi:diguanylate cyclase (GGDEF)-like protein/PAS domain S-box-containing protein
MQFTLVKNGQAVGYSLLLLLVLLSVFVSNAALGSANVLLVREDSAEKFSATDLATAADLITENGIANPRIDGELPDEINQFLSTNAMLFYVVVGVAIIAILTLGVAVVQKRSFRTPAAFPLLILVCGFALTYVFQRNAELDAHLALQGDFDRQSQEIIYRIEQRLALYHQILRGAKGLFIGSDRVERADFREYVAGQRLGENYPGVQGIGFSLVINPDEKASHIEAVRKEGFQNYLVHPEGTRDRYTSIVYLEPFDYRNQRALGYDMYSESARRQAMERARDTDAAALSGKVLLVQETAKDVQAGVLIYVPIYRKGKPIETLAERRANILGWVYSPFRMDDLMSGIVRDKTSLLHLKLYDGNSQAAEALLFDSDATNVISSQPDHQFTQQIVLIGHRWTASMHSLPSFEQSKDTGRVVATLAIGGALSIILSMLVWFLSSTRTKAINVANKMTAELQLSKGRYDRLAANIPVGVYLLQTKDLEEFEFVYVSPQFCALLNVTEEEVYKSSHIPFGTIHPSDAEELVHLNQIAVKNQSPFLWEGRALHQGQTKWLRIEATPEKQESDGRCLWDGLVTDITDRVNASEKIRKLAFFDELTKLPNRRMLYDRLDQLMASSKRSQSHAALMFLDLDNFKSLNDKHGHLAGDLLLIEVASRLQRCLREMDTVARMGGDEFVVLLSELDKDKATAILEAQLITNKILSAISESYVLYVHSEGQSTITLHHHCTASIGVAVFISDDDNQGDIMKHADAAMYQAKAAGRNAIRFYGVSTAQRPIKTAPFSDN